MKINFTVTDIFIMRLINILILISLIGCAKGEDPPTSSVIIPYPDGLNTNYITVNGISRKFLIYKPMGLTNPIALVFVLHGGGGIGADGISQEGKHPLAVFRTVADTSKFMVVFPEGQPDSQDKTAWTDCRSDNLLGCVTNDVLNNFCTVSESTPYG